MIKMQEQESKFVSGGKFIKSYVGNSSEPNPDSTILATGSSILEANTGKAFIYDGSVDKWYNPKDGTERGASTT